MRPPFTVGELLDAYMADRLAVVAAPGRLRSTVAHLRRHLADEPAAGVGRARLIAYVAARCAEGVRPQTVRREFVTLRAALRLAWRDGRLAAVPPVPMPPAGSSRQRVLSAGEIARLRAAARHDAALALFVDLALATGARRAAILELAWDRVDLAAGTIDFRCPHPRATRRKHRAVVPLTPALAAILCAAPRRAGARVVPLSEDALRRRFRAAAAAAGLAGITPHVLRHTAATHLLRHVPLVIASRMIGHRSVAVTEQVYGHLSVADLAPAAACLGRLVATPHSLYIGAC